jgi:pyrroloquinoline quinone (PQQ) biosynthesis protein C
MTWEPKEVFGAVAAAFARGRLGFSEADLEFFTVHIEGDEEHADVGYQLCERYATTQELEEMAIGACRASAQMRVAYLEGITRSLDQLTC